MARLQNEDRRLEKERLECVNRFCEVAKREMQDRKHARLSFFLEQRRAATEQIRLDNRSSLLSRHRALKELRGAELQQRKQRTFLINNPGARPSPKAKSFPLKREQPVVGSGINDAESV